jgi:hypothetical protein
MSEKTILFTDPASLGKNNYYSSTGDVDDVACIIYMSQKIEGKLSVVICDDETGQRYSSFLELIGNELIDRYGITVISENEFTNTALDPQVKINIHIHAPILDTTAQKLSENIQNINNVYTQGDDTAVNFRNSQGAKDFISEFKDVKAENLHRYDTEETNFTLSYDPDFQNTLTVPHVSEIYKQYFLFQQRKSFGTALHLHFLCNHLYSDKGLKGQPGNGIKKYKELIKTLKDEGTLQSLSGNLLTAFDKTVLQHGKCDESAIQNGKDLISLMNLYCNYENLIVDGKLPNMGNLGNVQKREVVDERVSRLFDIVPGFTSTPLFDFAAAYYAINGESNFNDNVLIEAAKLSLTELNGILKKRKIGGSKLKKKTFRKKYNFKGRKKHKNNSKKRKNIRSNKKTRVQKRNRWQQNKTRRNKIGSV